MDNELNAIKSFLGLALGTETKGYVCLAFSPDLKQWREEYYSWPGQVDEAIDSIVRHRTTENAYFCPQLLEGRKRNKDGVVLCPSIWADLDTCHPSRLLVEPNLIVESSPGRFQAVWSLETPMVPSEAENLALRIAYHHAPDGADRSGYDLSQLLRVPLTYNLKYDGKPQIVLRQAKRAYFRPIDFAEYPPVQGTKELMLPMPEVLIMEEPLDIMQRYRNRMDPRAFGLFSQEPESASWSEPLWKLMMYLFEAGMTREEVFIIAEQAACNKYRRDNKPVEHLWRDVCRAWLRNEENMNVVISTVEMNPLLGPGETSEDEGFVERYIEWASSLGDAAPQYHQAGAFVILSSLLSGNVRIPTSWGNIVPNLWFMILGDTTITRKSTAMDMAMDLIFELDEDILMATDGSVEGLLQALSMRPGRPSVFLRDEFSGMLEAMTRKDYLAGMMEMFTKLYDGKTEKRLLRKEIITVTKPILIMFTGGIKSRIQSLLSFEHISSGFLPRFVFLTAVSDVARVLPLGPPSERNLGRRNDILDEMQELMQWYQVEEAVNFADGIKVDRRRVYNTELTPKAWERYNQLEADMLRAGVAAERQELMTPLYARLSISTLKAATLIAASQQRTDKVVVEEKHIIRAIDYAEGWRGFGNDMVNGIGKNAMERDIDRVYNAIVNTPGIPRSKLMQMYHLTARSADAIFGTLEQRGLITGTRRGRGVAYTAVG